MAEPSILVVDNARIVNLDIQGALSRLDTRLSGTTTFGAEAALCIIPDIPVVFLTTCCGEVAMRRAQTSLPFGFLIEPFEDRELRGIIELGPGQARAPLGREVRPGKTAFGCAQSYDVRTPINGIAGRDEGCADTAETLLRIELLAEFLSRRSFPESQTNDRQGADAS
jgi:two-component system, sensor histidine kinase